MAIMAIIHRQSTRSTDPVLILFLIVILYTPINGAINGGGHHRNTCTDQGSTDCCLSNGTQLTLTINKRIQFNRTFNELINDLRSTLQLKTLKFDEFFKQLLKNSKKDFHQMFLQTYGLLYERNSYLFTDLFKDLEEYYSNGGVNLGEALDGFFQRLYQKMFIVLNSQYTFDKAYLQCISENMDKLKPFGDIPDKLKIEVKRSFIATRTFIQALGYGKDVVRNMMKISPAFECSNSLMKSTYCPHCEGTTDMKPCSNHCINAVRSCHSDHLNLDKEWNNYIDALLLLARRLQTSFNIESVVDPIDIKISEAIMNFQENGLAVSQRLFESCGKPRMGKREAKDKNLSFNEFKFSRPKYAADDLTVGATNMEQLLHDIKKKMKRSKNLWSKLLNILCENEQQSGVSTTNSRNGTKIIYSENPETSPSYNGQRNGSKFGSSKRNAIISQQILTLKLITTKLNSAYNGLDVDWQDNLDNDFYSGSGSGSGDGSDEAAENTDSETVEEDIPLRVNPENEIFYFSPSSTPKMPSRPSVQEDVNSNNNNRIDLKETRKSINHVPGFGTKIIANKYLVLILTMLLYKMS